MKTEKMQKQGDVYFQKGTPMEVMETLLKARRKGTHIRLFYGDTTTGKSWNDIHDVRGYIEMSTGTKPIPLLVYNKRSLGGGGILADCIVAIRESRGEKFLYKHPNFVLPKVDILNTGIRESSLPYEVKADGQLVGRCATHKEARSLARQIV